MGASDVAMAMAGRALLVWLALLFARDGFWRAEPRIERLCSPTPARWPDVVALVPALPLAALRFLAMTVDSARQHRLGRGGAWRGRLAGCGGATQRPDSLQG